MTGTAITPRTMGDVIETAIRNDPRLKSHHTYRQYPAHIMHFETFRNGAPMTKSLVEAYAASLQKLNYAPNTINQRLAAIRWWARKITDMAEDHLLDDVKAARITKQAARVVTVRDVKGERPQRGRYLSQQEQTALLAACRVDTSPAGIRDAAMISVSLSCGFRRDDNTNLRMADIKDDDGESCVLVIHGKGDRVDKLYLDNGGYRALHAWLTIRGQLPGQVFCPVRKNDKINTRGKLSGEALRKILDVRQMPANLPEHITWHDFRKTFVCTLLDNGVDLSTTQKAARHASPNTTANIYDIRGEQRKRAAFQTIHIPE